MTLKITRRCKECNGLGRLHLSNCWFSRCVIDCPACGGHGYIVEKVDDVMSVEEIRNDIKIMRPTMEV